MTEMDYQDEISKKLDQAIAIDHLLRANDNFKYLSSTIIANTLWVIGDPVEDANKLLDESWKLERKA